MRAVVRDRLALTLLILSLALSEGPFTSPEGHLIVARYEVPGNGKEDTSVPKGRSMVACAREAVCRPRAVRSIAPTGTDISFYTIPVLNI